MKSYFYGKDLPTLHNQRAVRVKETKNAITVEFVYRYNWTKETKNRHPEFKDFCVRCIGKNKNNVPFKAGVVDNGENKGHFFFQCGPDLDIVNQFIQDPKAIYKLSNEEMVRLDIF